MKLFDREKDWILKITNAVLLFWLLGAIIVTFSCVLDVVYTEPVMTYEEYSQTYCIYYDETNVESVSTTCQDDYDNNAYYTDGSDYDKTRSLIISAGNVVIVSVFLTLLNRKKKGKK
jgi:hypothetical protein